MSTWLKIQITSMVGKTAGSHHLSPKFRSHAFRNLGAREEEAPDGESSDKRGRKSSLSSRGSRGGSAGRGYLQRAVSLFSCPTQSAAPHPHSWPASAANSARRPATSCSGWPVLRESARSLCCSRPRRVQKDARRGAGPCPAARPTGKVSTRRWRPGRAEGEASPGAHTHTAVTSAPAGTETQSRRSSALGWSLPSWLLGTECPGQAALGAQRARQVPVTQVGWAQGAGRRGRGASPDVCKGAEGPHGS